MFFGKDPGKDHLCRHIGIQPVILADNIKSQKEQKCGSQQDIRYLFFQCFHTADLSELCLSILS